MSYYATPQSFYQPDEVATPFWQLAPVPGWGINPLTAGPPRVGIGQCSGCSGSCGGACGGCGCGTSIRGLGAAGDEYKETSWGMVALGTTGGIFLGMLFSWAWYASRKKA